MEPLEEKCSVALVLAALAVLAINYGYLAVDALSFTAGAISIAGVKSNGLLLPVTAIGVLIGCGICHVRHHAYDGGLGLYALERLPVGKKVIVQLGFWDSRGLLCFETVDGVVRWTRPKGHGYAAGIRFDGLTPEKHQRIVAFLEHTDREVQPGLPPAL
ncbi:MAG: PilZ domain-containing protein [Nitrospirae bacterium]|nr:PilZ domain-containing protein [Nitrospirota bacterium]